MATAAIFSLICVVEEDFTSLCGRGIGVLRAGGAGDGVTERERAVGRPKPFGQPLLTNRKL